MTIEEIKERLKALRKLRQAFIYGPVTLEELQKAETELHEQLLDSGFCLIYVYYRLDYGIFCNEE